MYDVCEWCVCDGVCKMCGWCVYGVVIMRVVKGKGNNDSGGEKGDQVI